MRLLSWLRVASAGAAVLCGSVVVSAGKGGGGSTGGGATCGVLSDTNILLYADGANGADPLWFQDMLNWWKTSNPTLKVQSLVASQIAGCNLASFTNLRVFIHPGGDSYVSLSALGASGVAAVRDFVRRDQTPNSGAPNSGPSAYVGACAGAYSAGHDYIWETMYEGTSYYNFQTNPPYSFFPHTTEGSIVDISDAQFGSYQTNGQQMWRVVTTSNGHRMIYWGGPTFGFNGLPDYSNPASPIYDPNVTPILYFQDFYGFNTYNLPAAWTYKLANFARANILQTSVHVEASQATCTNGCLPANTLSDNQIKSNWAWLLTYINQVAATSYTIPSTTVAPSFNTAKPHTAYPTQSCYTGNVLFCDDFTYTNTPGSSYPGMYQWQRNQTLYNGARPWNVTFTSTMMGQTNYYGTGAGGAGDGWAFVIPNQGTLAAPATITSKVFSTTSKNTVTLQFKYKGKTLTGGYFKAQYTINDGASWTDVHSGSLYPAVTAWQSKSVPLPVGEPTVQIRFLCSSGAAVTNHCGVDDVKVSYT